MLRNNFAIFWKEEEAELFFQPIKQYTELSFKSFNSVVKRFICPINVSSENALGKATSLIPIFWRSLPHHNSRNVNQRERESPKTSSEAERKKGLRMEDRGKGWETRVREIA